MSIQRLKTLFCALVFLFGGMLCRVYWVCTDTSYAASADAQTVSDTLLPRRRGDFYDRDGQALTGVVKRWYALCIPGDSSYSSLFPHVSYAAQTRLYEMRNATAPFLVEVQDDLTQQGVYTYAGAQRYLPLPIAPHLIGYLDGDGFGVSGLERAYEDILSRSGDTQSVECVTTARGMLLSGSNPTVQVSESGTGQSVQLTLDTDIQRACEGIAGLYMPRGCIVVMDVATGEVLASVSTPEFAPDNVGKSIRADDTSLINRPLAAFSVGSVFKVAAAVAAYQHGLDWYTHDCTGSVEVAGQTYRCAKGRAHGLVNLRAALEQSCNCYFIELGQALGGDALLWAAQAFGFGTPCAVAPGLKSSAGSLPDEGSLQNAGQLAVFSFGQGALTATPLQVTAMMNTVAGGGIYRTPRFVKGILDGSLKQTEPLLTPDPVRVCHADVARVVRNMLQTVVEEGIGDDAAPDELAAGGKTGTAQTGQFDQDGEELLNHWFSGFYPAENPRYTITVLQDGLLEPEYSSAALFAMVANSLHLLQNS